jgi:4-amino-4-deoxy-L-arabinose transferase-like glycosyltransferase
VYLLAILILAVLLRAFNNSPSFYSFWVDEATFANRSIYILEHGGQYNPADLYDHPPLFMYIQAVFFKLLGPEWYAARGLAVLLGALSVLVVFLIGREWRDERLGLMFAALFAVQSTMVGMNRQSMMENLLLLLLAASFLAILKYDRTSAPRFMLIAAFFFGLAMLTKLTALLFLFPLLAYAAVRRLHRVRAFYVSLAVVCLMVVPVVLLMLPHGFLDFHLRKTGSGDMGVWIGNSFFKVGHLGALVMTVLALNILVGVFLEYLYRGARRPGKSLGLSNLRAWCSKNRLTFTLLAWAGGSLAFFSMFVFITEQYVFTMVFPFLLLAGLALYGWRKRYTGALMAVCLAISVIWITGVGMPASNETVVFLQSRVAPGDVLVASDAAVFRYYFPDNDVETATAGNVAGANATYLVLKTSLHDSLMQNQTSAGLLEDHYIQVFETHEGPQAVNFVVLKRVG